MTLCIKLWHFYIAYRNNQLTTNHKQMYISTVLNYLPISNFQLRMPLHNPSLITQILLKIMRPFKEQTDCIAFIYSQLTN